MVEEEEMEKQLDDDDDRYGECDMWLCALMIMSKSKMTMIYVLKNKVF